jgi:hypothetical protein
MATTFAWRTSDASCASRAARASIIGSVAAVTTLSAKRCPSDVRSTS